MEIDVMRVSDFEPDGAGTASAWQDIPWNELQRVGAGLSGYTTRFKVAWSSTGLYVLTDSEDQRLSCTLTRDNDVLYTEDVIEVFLWPDEDRPLYFEYEISPLGFELPILVPNPDGEFMGWLPWGYEGERRIRKATSVRGGPNEAGAIISGWSAEFFVPFALFKGIAVTPPEPGSSWRANVYRIDYDQQPTSQWAWEPATGGNFHDYRNFGTITFH